MGAAALDVAIVGGGLVGASLAVALEGSGLKVALIEAASPPASAPSWDERCIALNDGSRRVFEQIGVWDQLSAQTAAITATHISERGRFGMARFTAAEARLEALGYNTPLRLLGASLLERVRAQTDVRWLVPARVNALALEAAAATLTLDGGEMLRAKLVVAADGANSTLRGLLGLAAEVRDYAQSAIVTAVLAQRDPQGVAYERFTPQGPLAVIPKPRAPEEMRAGHPCSLIWTLPTDKAVALQAQPEAEFLAAAQATFGERLGRFQVLGHRMSYPLQRTVGETLLSSRLVFCGNAAQSLHPVAAQGFNLGLRDVAALAVRLRAAAATGSDPGEPQLLREYVDARAQDRQSTAGFTDQLVRVFSNQLPVVSTLRHVGLLALDLVPAAREAVLRQNLGHSGLSI